MSATTTAAPNYAKDKVLACLVNPSACLNFDVLIGMPNRPIKGMSGTEADASPIRKAIALTFCADGFVLGLPPKWGSAENHAWAFCEKRTTNTAQQMNPKIPAGTLMLHLSVLDSRHSKPERQAFVRTHDIESIVAPVHSQAGWQTSIIRLISSVPHGEIAIPFGGVL